MSPTAAQPPVCECSLSTIAGQCQAHKDRLVHVVQAEPIRAQLRKHEGQRFGRGLCRTFAWSSRRIACVQRRCWLPPRRAGGGACPTCTAVSSPSGTYAQTAFPTADAQSSHSTHRQCASSELPYCREPQQYPCWPGVLARPGRSQRSPPLFG